MRRRKRFLAKCCIAVGILLMLFPLFGVWKEKRSAKSHIHNYESGLQNVSAETLRQAKEAAQAYNRILGDILIGQSLDYSITEINARYEELLNVNGDGVMGYISIPAIHVDLPIGHTESESAASHLRNTSLPVGGNSTHAVIAAHTGLASSRQFTDLASLEIGDRFYLYILDEVLCYQIDQILVAEPSETDKLMVERGKDMVTLLTCTPYGINSHRLLVRGQRVTEAAGPQDTEAASRGSEWNRQYFLGLLRNLIGIPIGICIFYYLYRLYQKRMRKRRRTQNRRKP